MQACMLNFLPFPCLSPCPHVYATMHSRHNFKGLEHMQMSACLMQHILDVCVEIQAAQSLLKLHLVWGQVAQDQGGLLLDGPQCV